jgi:acid phosphatase (class A)
VTDPSVNRCPQVDISHLDPQSSHPSGHAAHGWGWALVLAEAYPSRAREILQRGREYGDSRVVCGFHFPSDVEVGRMVGALVVARLHADEGFRAQLVSAHEELAQKLR